ncbi:ribonuclease G [Lachnospiraceae bacterium KH1T2]|nr:ribonuclease G [Lachnospiraceae bacterium KH1T2]
MKTKFVISRYSEQLLMSVFEDDKLNEFFFSDETETQIGSIYIGHVKELAVNLRAAFVDIGNGKIGYLPLNKNSQVHAESDVLVQISNDAIKTKDLRLTEQISISGKYLALTLGKPGIGFSRKIHSEERKKELTGIIENEFDQELKAQKVGVVVRTNAEEADDRKIQAELEGLSSEMLRVLSTWKSRTVHSCMYRPVRDYIARIRDDRCEIERIVTDLPDVYEELGKFFGNSELADCIAFYKDELLPLNKLYSVDTVIQESLQKKAWMKSGGYLIIEPTEALTVVDVNSGKNTKKCSRENLIMETNIEAVWETARQLRLRNISGMILIDLINMTDPKDKSKVISELKKALAGDYVISDFVDVTKLGLAEITRKKVRRSLAEQIKKQKY